MGTVPGTEAVGTLQAGSYEVAVAVSRSKAVNQNGIGSSQISQVNDPTSSRVEDLAIRKQLQAMLRSSSIPSNLIPTQEAQGLEGIHPTSQHALSAATSPKRGSSVGIEWNSRRQRHIAANKMAELIVQAWALEMHNQSYSYLLDMDHLRGNNKIKRLNPGRDVNCECGSNHEEDAMVRFSEALKSCSIACTSDMIFY